MRADIEQNLAGSIEPKLVSDLLNSYQVMVVESQKGGFTECLTASGKFVEHTLRIVEFIRTKTILKEIKNVAELVKSMGSDSSLGDSLRVIVPKMAQGLYEVRSKRGAVHVKDIDPLPIDAAVSVHCASWIVAELLRLYHSDDASVVAEAMVGLMRAELPLIEQFGTEVVVTTKVPITIEMLLLVAKRAPKGVSRKVLGTSSKFASPRVSEALQKLEADLFLHKTADGNFHITGPGEQHLTAFLAKRTQQTAIGNAA